MTSVSQQKMTLFFLSRSSSSFVALNTTSVAYVFVRTKTNDVLGSFRCFPEWTIKVTSVSQQKMTLFFSSRSSSSFVALDATLGG